MQAGPGAGLPGEYTPPVHESGLVTLDIWWRPKADDPAHKVNNAKVPERHCRGSNVLRSLVIHQRNAQHPLRHCPSILWCMLISATKYGGLRQVKYRNERNMQGIFRILPEVMVDLAALNSAITRAYYSPRESRGILLAGISAPGCRMECRRCSDRPPVGDAGQ